MSEFFYDSYAIIEFINNNPRFVRYFTENGGVTTLYNVLEVYYAIIKEGGAHEAKKVLELLRPIIVYPDISYVEESMKFRLENKEKKLSYADCLGYIIAKRKKIKFLTGDEGFRHLANVEFVKANEI